MYGTDRWRALLGGPMLGGVAAGQRVDVSDSGRAAEAMGTAVRQIVVGVEVVIVLIVVVLGSARPTMVEIGPGPSGTVSGDGAREIYSPEGGRVRGEGQAG